MNFPLIHTDSGKKFYSWNDLRLWLVQTHSIARPEDAPDLPQILADKGVADHIDTPDSLAVKQANVWNSIKSEREARRIGGVSVAGKWFHTDDPSRIQHLGLTIMGAGIPADLQWKTMDGTFVAMTQTLAGQIFTAVAAADQANFSNAETHRVAMELLPDPIGYDYSTGWLPVFGG